MTLITFLEWLPVARRSFLTVLMAAGGCDLIACIVLLAYQLALTEGYQKAVPAVLSTSVLSAAFPAWFLYSRPYSITLPLTPKLSAEPAAGGLRDKLAKFSRSIAAEVFCLGGLGVWVLIAVSNLHAETPGLISHCGGYPICRMLLAVLALTWITFLFLGLAFTSLLVSTLYFTIRRHSALPIFTTPFGVVDWERYSGRPVNRANTVRVPRRTKEERERQRGTSEAPVLPSHMLGKSVGGSSLGGAGEGLDWDVQSTLSSSRISVPNLPYGGIGDGRPNSVATSIGMDVGVEMGLAEMARQEMKREQRDDAVFVLIDDEGEAKADEKTDAAVGKAQ